MTRVLAALALSVLGLGCHKEETSVPVGVVSEARELAAPGRSTSKIAAVRGASSEVRDLLARESLLRNPLPTRIRLARRGPIFFTAQGRHHGAADEVAFQRPSSFLVVADTEYPRIVVEAGGVRLLVYVRREDAVPVVVADAPLRPSSDLSEVDATERGYIVLRAGAWVDVEDTTESSARVVYTRRDDGQDLRGWIDASVLGSTVTLGGPSADDRESANSWWVTRRKTGVAVTPGGPLLAEAFEGESVRELGRLQGPHRLVEYAPTCDENVRFIGYIRDADLFRPNWGAAIGCGWKAGTEPRRWGDAESFPRVELAAGTFLIDVDTNELVGCVVEPEEVADLGDGRYAVATIWGPALVGVADPGIAADCGTKPPPGADVRW